MKILKLSVWNSQVILKFIHQKLELHRKLLQVQVAKNQGEVSTMVWEHFEITCLKWLKITLKFAHHYWWKTLKFHSTIIHHWWNSTQGKTQWKPKIEDPSEKREYFTQTGEYHFLDTWRIKVRKRHNPRKVLCSTQNPGENSMQTIGKLCWGSSYKL